MYALIILLFHIFINNLFLFFHMNGKLLHYVEKERGCEKYWFTPP